MRKPHGNSNTVEARAIYSAVISCHGALVGNGNLKGDLQQQESVSLDPGRARWNSLLQPAPPRLQVKILLRVASSSQF